MTNIEIAWLAGLLEGEGSFIWRHRKHEGEGYYGGPTVSVFMTDKDVINKVAILIGGRLAKEARRKVITKIRKPVYYTRVSDVKAAYIMELIIPYMGERRSAKIKECLEKWKSRPGKGPRTKAYFAKMSLEERRAYMRPVLQARWGK